MYLKKRKQKPDKVSQKLTNLYKKGTQHEQLNSMTYGQETNKQAQYLKRH